MKTIEQIIETEPVFLHNWGNREDVLRDFEEEDREPVRILFASYTYESYSGNAWVLFTRDGKLYEVNGSHCSCYGLEGQWREEEVLLAELENRIVEGRFGNNYDGHNEFKTELERFLGITI